MHVTKCLLGHELLCDVHMCELYLESSGIYCRITAASLGSARRGENIACLLLWLLWQPGERLCCVRLCYSCCYGCCIGQGRKTCLQFLKLFESPSSLLAHKLPTIGSANSEVTGITNRVSNIDVNTIYYRCGLSPPKW